MRKLLFQIILYVICFLLLVVLPLVCLPLNSDNYTLAQKEKMDLLAQTADTPRVVILGGSSCAFGFVSKALSDSLDMQVVNMGLHAGMGSKFIIDNYLSCLHEGDIVILSPEYENYFGEGAYGEMVLVEVFLTDPFLYCSLLNVKQWRTMFLNLPSSLHKKIMYYLFAKMETIYNIDSFNCYGDFVGHWGEENIYSKRKNQKILLGEINVDYIESLVCQLRYIQSQGANVYYLPPVISESAFEQIEDKVLQVDSVLKLLDFPFICDPADMAYNDTLFYDTRYHLGKIGAKLRTLQVYSLLKLKKREDAIN